jgi:hypothetical protein
MSPPPSGCINSRSKPEICLDELKKAIKNLGQDNQYHGRDSNLIPPEYMLEALLLQPVFKRIVTHTAYVARETNCCPTSP